MALAEEGELVVPHAAVEGEAVDEGDGRAIAGAFIGQARAVDIGCAALDRHCSASTTRAG